MDYECHLVTKNCVEPKVFSVEEIAAFEILNKEMAEKMMSDLVVENPEDARRRKAQAAVLSMPPTKISENSNPVLVVEVDKHIRGVRSRVLLNYCCGVSIVAVLDGTHCTT